MKKNTTAQAEEIQAKADKIEKLLANPKTGKQVLYALRAVLIELSNESGVGVDSATVAGNFYKVAAAADPSEVIGNDIRPLTFQTCLRHIDALLRQGCSPGCLNKIRKQRWRKSYADAKAGEKRGYLKLEKQARAHETKRIVSASKRSGLTQRRNARPALNPQPSIQRKRI